MIKEVDSDYSELKICSDKDNRAYESDDRQEITYGTFKRYISSKEETSEESKDLWNNSDNKNLKACEFHAHNVQMSEFDLIENPNSPHQS